MEYLVLDVSGTKYHLLFDTLEKFPNTLLSKFLKQDKSADADESGIHRTKRANYFFVQRSPSIFEAIILPYYLSGVIHVPPSICRERLREEIEFWQLELNFCQSCVSEHERKSFSDSEEISNDTDLSEGPVEKEPSTTYCKWKQKLWEFCENPFSSKAASLFAVTSITFVFVSILALVIGSIPNLQFCPEENATALDMLRNISRIERELLISKDNSSIDNSTVNLAFLAEHHPSDESFIRRNFFSLCQGTRVFDIIQTTCIIWFTIELLFRFCVCPNRLKFLRVPQNIVDFGSTFPFYVELMLWAINFNMNHFSTVRTLLLLLRFLRVAKVFAVLKLARYFPELRILGATLKAASRELMMLTIFILVNLLIFSSIVYNFEKDEPNTQFTSIPASFWWGIATLTTVGYGDMTPKSTGGKFIGGVACVTGVMIMALPISVLVDQFTSAYKTLSKSDKDDIDRKSNDNLKQSRDDERVTSEKRRVNVIKHVLLRKYKLNVVKAKNYVDTQINVAVVFYSSFLRRSQKACLISQ